MLNLNESYKTKIYLAGDGYIVIEQKNGDDRNAVLLNPEQAETLAGFITDFAEKHAELWVDATLSGDELT
jgi:hypothetical protein